MNDKNRGYHQQAVKRHYGGALRGLAHNQLYRQRGLFGCETWPRQSWPPPRCRRAPGDRTKNAGRGAAVRKRASARRELHARNVGQMNLAHGAITADQSLAPAGAAFKQILE